jgi:hypothetical protein
VVLFSVGCSFVCLVVCLLVVWSVGCLVGLVCSVWCGVALCGFVVFVCSVVFCVAPFLDLSVRLSFCSVCSICLTLFSQHRIRNCSPNTALIRHASHSRGHLPPKIPGNCTPHAWLAG